MEPTPIAIVGMSCRFPGSVNTPEQLWDMLEQGRTAWSDVPRDRFKWESFYHPDPDLPNATNHRGGHFLDQDVRVFDARFFGIAGHEAETMDPQQRMLIELSYEALENAGIPLPAVRGSPTGVYVATFNNDYNRILSHDPANLPKTTLTGVGTSMLANKISYLFDLKGPSLVVDTACSGSLVALHQACQALRTQEIDTAITGAANLILDPDIMISMSQHHFLNAEGRSFSFDARGDGYGRGEGIGIVVLKRLEDAIRDGDAIRAVIRNTGLGQDGKTAGITLPSAEAQASLIRSVYARASLDPRDTPYVEAHGTGTVAGDFAELETISRLFCGNATDEQKQVHVTSIKANIGHTESTSGIAGLIKAALVVEKGLIPPNPPITELKRDLITDDSGVVIPQEMTQWPSAVRRASIVSQTSSMRNLLTEKNSFGYGGTNAHCILESSDLAISTLNANQNHRHLKDIPLDGHTPSNLTMQTQTQFLLPLSSSSQVSLNQTTADISQWVGAGSRSRDALRNLAYTLSSRRTRLSFRRSLIGLSTNSVGKIHDSKPRSTQLKATNAPVRLTFVFTGQGAQWYAMGRELLGGSTVFAASIARSEQHLRALGASWSLVEELSREKETSRVNESEIGQPASTAIQVALVDLLASLGIKPFAVVGHSSGEIAAAYAAGVLDHDTVMKISYHRSLLAERSRLITEQKGSMLAVGVGEKEASQYISTLKSGKVSVACANSPKSTTISGDEGAINELLEILQRSDTFVRKLQVDTAYHSHHMQAVATDYAAALGNIPVSALSDVRFYSSVTGTEKKEGFDGTYWVENLVSKVNFHSAISKAFEGGAEIADGLQQVFLEIGSHHALAGPMRDTFSAVASARGPTCLPTLFRGTDAILSILELGGRLFEEGCDLDLDSFNCLDGNEERPQLVTDLAPYPWDHSTGYWTESRLAMAYRQREHPSHELLGLRIPGSSPSEPAWRHILNSATMPWLLEHIIDGYPIFPGSGYITMAIEAKRQLNLERGISVDVRNYIIKDLLLVRPLIIPDSPQTVEVQISLRSTRRGKITNWESFVISSVSSDGTWSEHATGAIMTELKPTIEIKSTATTESAFSHDLEFRKLSVLEGKDTKSLPESSLYDIMAAKGNVYGPTFAAIRDFQHDKVNAVGQLILPDTAESMPAGVERAYVMHPGPLDALLHSTVPLFFENSSAASVMAVEVERVVISATGLSTPGTELDFVTTIDPIGATSAAIHVSAFGITEQGEKQLLVQIINGRLKGTADSKEADEASEEYDQTYTIEWHEDVDLVLSGKIDTQVPQIEPPEEKFRLLNQAASIFIQLCVREVPESDIMLPCKAFYDWMQRYVASEECKELIDHLGESERQDIIQKLDISDIEGKGVLRVGHSLKKLIQGTEDLLALVTEDDLLFSAYTDDGAARCYLYMLEFVKSVAFKKPKLRVLEIGAGTGSATSVLLNGLGEEWYASIERYDYTDVSPAFFDRARENFRKHGSFMHFRELDITQDPTDQGFAAGYYDLVIASNSIHVVPKIDNAVRRVRSLLKPGGRLLLVESTRVVPFSNMLFGHFQDWYCGLGDGRMDSPLLSVAEWHPRLARNGFDGVQSSRNDFEGYAQRVTFIVAQAIESANHPHDTPVQIVVSPRASTNHLNAVDALAKTLAAHGKPASVLSLPVQSLDDSAVYLIADDRQNPILADQLESEWVSVTRILNQTNMRLLWVNLTHDSVAKVPCEHGLSRGLCQSARTENPSLKVVNVDVIGDLSATSNTSQMLLNILDRTFYADAAYAFDEYEVELHNGRPLIPRLRPNDSFNFVMKQAAGFNEPENVAFHQHERPLKLTVERPGLLDNMVFSDDTRLGTPLPPHEVQVCAKAFGVNFKDVMLAMGQLDETLCMAGEFAGIVTAVGENFKNEFSVGDRVCGVNGTPYASQCRTHGYNLYHCPESLTLSEGASIPVVFATAYHCLVDLARLQPHQSVLIHAATGGVGQAAITIAQQIGADIYVTVGTKEKADFIVERLGIPRDHIFTSRSRLFKASLMRMTNGNGVDVVLNSLSEDLLDESLECVARFGSFIEIGKYDINRKNSISLHPFEKGIKFFSVDLSAICKYRPHVIRSLLTNVIDALASDIYKLVNPLRIIPLNKIEEAFRLLQTGKHFGKIVLEANDDTNVIATTTRGDTTNYTNCGTFVIAGGLGGLGLELARHLAAHGARHVALLSRRALPTSKRTELRQEFQKLGAELYIVQCDIAHISSQAILKEQLEIAPPVETIIQSAMVIDNESIEHMSQDQFLAALPSKLDGSRNLLNTFAGPSLKQMILFSSVTGTFGSMRGANYAAANSAQDAFALGQGEGTTRVVAIDIGPMKDIGALSQETSLVDKIAAQGFVPWGAYELFALLDSLLDPKSTRTPLKQLLVGFNKKSMSKATRAHAVGNPVLKHVLESRTSDIRAEAGPSEVRTTTLAIKSMMENAANFQEATAIVHLQLATKICSFSSMDLDAMTDDVPLSAYSLDSLVVVELKNWIARAFSATLQSTEISNAPNLAALSATIANKSTLFKKQHLIDSADSSDESKDDIQDDSLSSTETSISEADLPRQPLIKLDQSIQQYLAEVEPICSSAEFEATREKAMELLQQSGPKLQEKLQKMADDPMIDNWFTDLYLNCHYLQRRSSLLDHSSFFNNHPLDTSKYSATDIATALTRATLAYKRNLEVGQNEARYLVDKRIDVSAESHIFNVCRQPGIAEDCIVRHGNSDHIVVLRRGHAFKLAPLDYSAAELKAVFEAILCLELNQLSHMSALTGDRRDVWAKCREALISLSDKNAATIREIEASAFVVCLDDAIPVGQEQRALQFLFGDQNSNRWYDKALQFVICPDGSAASVIEHTLLDGTSLAPMREFTIPRTQQELESIAACEPTPMFDPHSAFTPLPFITDEAAKAQVSNVLSATSALRATNSFEAFALPDLGIEYWRAYKIPPKSGMQLLVQLAVHALYGYNPPATETVSLAHFQNGRVALMNLVTPQVKAFCNLVHLGERLDLTKARKAFLEAIAAHNASIVRTRAGEAPIRNLTALQWVAQKQRKAVPALFSDEAWQRFSNEVVTVDCYESDFEECGLPQMAEGIWTHFQTQQHRTIFSVWGRLDRRASDFRRQIEAAAEQVILILAQ